jgi:CBS domain-containing protein
MSPAEALATLKNTPPFNLLDIAVLRSIAKEMPAESYPKGRVILQQNGPAAEHLFIITEGAVKICVRTSEGEEVLVDYRASGDYFGLLSFICGDISRDTAVATEYTSCYLVRKDIVLELLKRNAEFAEHCYRSRLKRLTRMIYREIRDRTMLYGGGDKLLFTNMLGDLATRDVVTAPEQITIQKAAEIMSSRGISSIVLLDHHGMPSGILTDRDLRTKVVSKGRDSSGQAADIMSVTIIKSEAREYCFEALLKMMRFKIHHLLVVDKGELRGIITNHDLMMLQGTSPLSIARAIEDQDTIDGLVPASEKINKTLTLLIKEGARSSHITRIITEINDRLLSRILTLTEARVGPPPLKYCWIVFGSEGRKEQTFKTDQDNAIVYEDPKGNDGDARKYFSEFAALMNDSLAACGFPPCSADYMASNPKWCQPLSVWKNYFSTWIHSPTPEAILRSLIFFDFRPVYGDTMLAEQLRAFLGYEVKKNRMFLAHMAGVITRNRPPIGFFGNVRPSGKATHRGMLDIKINGLCPIIDIARILALERNVYHTSTLARLAELGDTHDTMHTFRHDLEEAFEFLMSLRLRHQFQQIEEGREPDNYLGLEGLGAMETGMLKGAFKVILSAQRSVMKKYSEWLIT